LLTLAWRGAGSPVFFFLWQSSIIQEGMSSAAWTLAPSRWKRGSLSVQDGTRELRRVSQTR
jgi:hypothetical protein